ncbi:GDCCVxC domain-containing (seleno)protein [Nitratireductor arenosus]|uniref:GDCCVxC domain-containing (seleno)protein n=1 Tax=Nitratireductor arenosus TaxID=2682096 RepID=UPI001FE3E284|nr:GDCCVxC domain-containing (seleno)protein [Nitratireductor arenosus]
MVLATLRRFSTLTCPHCGFSERRQMPIDACAFFHECGGCKQLLRPLDGDCCVFCSYGSEPCPPVQAGEAKGR